MAKITADNIDKEYYDSLNQNELGEETLNEQYFDLLNLYKNLFEQYLKEILPLELIDKKLEESDLNFIRVDKQDMDFYQSMSNMGLSFIYLRNNIYVEKLSSDELKFLSTKEELDDETREFIKSTCARVVNPYDTNKVMFYGPENGKFLCDSSDIVIGIRYDEFANNDKEFEETFLKKQKLISQVCSLIEVANNEHDSLNIKCIQYNEFSVSKRDNKQI